MNITGSTKVEYDSLEDATRILNDRGYSDTLEVRKEGLWSTNENGVIPTGNLGLYEAHRIENTENDSVRILFSVTNKDEPYGTLQITCGAEHADEEFHLENIMKYIQKES